MSEEGRRRWSGVGHLLGHAALSPVEHWLNNLRRFPPEHIGYRYAVEALAKLAPKALLEHWRDELKRFAPGHIRHEFASQALAKLASRIDGPNPTEVPKC